MLGVPLDTRVCRTLAVTVGDDLAVTVNDQPSKYFAAHLSPPAGTNSTFDGSPRTGLSSSTLYWIGAMAPLSASNRVEDLDGVEYELIARPEPVTSGRQTLGYSAPVLPVADLYPRAAELKANKGDDVLAEVICALFNESESKSQRGRYRDTFAELPPALWEAIDPLRNAELVFGDGSRWSLSNSTLSREVPYVTATAKRSG